MGDVWLVGMGMTGQGAGAGVVRARRVRLITAAIDGASHRDPDVVRSTPVGLSLLDQVVQVSSWCGRRVGSRWRKCHPPRTSAGINTQHQFCHRMLWITCTGPSGPKELRGQSCSHQPSLFWET